MRRDLRCSRGTGTLFPAVVPAVSGDVQGDTVSVVQFRPLAPPIS
jgi:hypothetical protein